MTVSVMRDEDLQELESFFVEYAETSMFQRSNLRAGGVVDRGDVYLSLIHI